MAISPTPSDIDVDDTSASSRVSTPGSSGLPTYNEDPSSDNPSTTLRTFGVPVYFQGIGANSYAVVTIAHICPSGLAGLMVNIQRKNTFPDSNQSPKSLSPARDTYVPLCAQASTTDTKFHSAWLDASSGYLYVLYSGSTGPSVSSINTNTLDVTNLPQVNPAMRDTHSMAIVNLSSGREINPGAVYLSKTSGLWILPINDLGSKTYFSLAQFPNDYEPADITASSNYVYTAGLNTTSKDYFIQKTNAIDGKKELQSYRAPFTKFLGKLEANHHNVTMAQKPMIVCNEVVYLALVYTNGTGLVLLTFSQSPFTMLSQSSFLIPADDTVLSMSCVSVANPHSGGKFFGIAILVNTEQHDDLYTITVDEGARASAPKVISKKIVVNTRDRVWSECNTIGFASESTNSTIGILSTTQSPPTRWNLDIVKNSYLEGVIPSKAICAVGYFFSSTSNDCVLCRGYRNPPTACLHRGSKGGGDHNYELDELDDLSLPLKLLAIIGSCVFLSLLIALCSYWFRCSKRNSISRQLTSSHISSMREPRCAMSDDSQKVLITPTNTTRSISTDSEKSLNMASTYIYPTKAANYDTHEYMTHDASPFTKSTPPIFRIHSYNEDNLSRMATKLISPIKYPEAIASNPKGVNAEHDLSPSRLILLSNNPMYERQVTIATLEHSLAGQSARIEEDSAAYSSQGGSFENPLCGELRRSEEKPQLYPMNTISSAFNMMVQVDPLSPKGSNQKISKQKSRILSDEGEPQIGVHGVVISPTHICKQDMGNNSSIITTSRLAIKDANNVHTVLANNTKSKISDGLNIRKKTLSKPQGCVQPQTSLNADVSDVSDVSYVSHEPNEVSVPKEPIDLVSSRLWPMNPPSLKGKKRALEESRHDAGMSSQIIRRNMNSVHKHGTNSQIFLVGGGERWLKEQAIRTNTSISAFAASRIRAEMNRSLDVFSSPASEGSSPVLNISGYRPHTLEADPGQDHLSSHGPAPLLRDSSFGPVDIRERLKPIRR